MNAIVINYFVCFSVGSLLLGRSPIETSMISADWFPYALFLSSMFIIFFNVNAYTTQKVGMIITSIFQKLSLVFPVVIAFFFFGEVATQLKVVAIVLTLVAIVLINMPSSENKEELLKLKQYWYWPFLVFFGSGLIESVLFYAQENGKVVDAGIEFVSILFFMSGCWGAIYMLVTRNLNFTIKEIIAGILIGVPNFFTIYLIIKGLDIGYEASVLFPLNNVGVIVMTAIIGLLVFKEKLNKFNYVGLALALVAVYLISS